METKIRRLFILGLTIPILTLIVLEILRFHLRNNISSPYYESGLVILIFSITSMIFAYFLYREFKKLVAQVSLHKRHQKMLLKSGDIQKIRESLGEYIYEVIGNASRYLCADYGEILIKEDGKVKVYYYGIDVNNCSVKKIPTLQGIKGKILRTGKPIRISSRREDPDSVELPEGHPPLGPLLGVPIFSGDGEAIAHILLARKPGKKPFTEEDQETLTILAREIAYGFERFKIYREIIELSALRERDRIARDLHDGLAQTLAFINIKAASIKEQFRSGNMEKVDKCLDELRNAVKQAYSEIRRAIFDLKITDIPEEDLKTYIEQFVKEFGIQNNIKTFVQLDGINELKLPLTSQVHVIRIIQESLSNIQKHAEATKVWVLFEHYDGKSLLKVVDNGKGFEVDNYSRINGKLHFGIQMMKERAIGIGGVLKINSIPGQGTEVILEFPDVKIENRVAMVSNGQNKGSSR